MNKASMFVMERTTDPVIDLYYSNLKSGRFTTNELNNLKKLKGNAAEAKKILGMLKEVGDVYKYLMKTISGPGKSTAHNFRNFGLVPFEDIINEFIVEFENELTKTTTVDTLELEGLYSTWDVVFLSNMYNVRGYGIQTIKNEIDEVEGIVARGRFDSELNNYANRWLNKDELIYNLIQSERTKKNINNTNILTGIYPIYIFETIGENQQVYQGKFKLLKYIKETHQVHLIRDELNCTKEVTNDVKVFKLPTIKQFNKQTEKKNADKFGTSQISKNKILSGQKAERVVINFLNTVSIKAVDVADNTKFPYDIHLEESNTGLEVKNILNGSFYISENEIRQIENNNTRLVIVHDYNIYMSKNYGELLELKRIFRDLREINAYIIEKYNGEYSNDDLKIGITKYTEEKIRRDFIRVNNLTKDEMLENINKSVQIINEKSNY